MTATTTPIADMITEMLKNCIPMEMIIVAVRSMERAVSTRHGVDETAEKRRAWDRQYRRARRGHPPDPPDIHPKPPEVSNSALSSSPEAKKLSVVGKKEKKERGGFKIPPDWKPNEHHYSEGLKLNMTRSMVDDRATAMRLWCEANAHRPVTTKSNWDSTFTGTWLKDSKYGSHAGNQQNGRRTVHDAAKDLLAKVRAFDAEPPGGICDGASEPPLRLLSSG